MWSHFMVFPFINILSPAAVGKKNAAILFCSEKLKKSCFKKYSCCPDFQESDFVLSRSLLTLSSLNTQETITKKCSNS